MFQQVTKGIKISVLTKYEGAFLKTTFQVLLFATPCGLKTKVKTLFNWLIGIGKSWNPTEKHILLKAQE